MKIRTERTNDNVNSGMATQENTLSVNKPNEDSIDFIINNRKEILTGVDEGKPYEFSYSGQEYKITTVDHLPDGVTELPTDIDIQGLTNENLINALEGVANTNVRPIIGRDSLYAIVPQNLTLINELNQKQKPIQQQGRKYKKFGISAFSGGSQANRYADNPGEKFDPYALIINNKGIGVITYNTQKNVFAFAVDCENDRRESPAIRTKSVFLTHFKQNLKRSQWLQKPLTERSITLKNQGNGQAVTLISLGTALKLQQEKNFFDGAPDFVQDILKKAQIEKDKMNIVKAMPADTLSTKKPVGDSIDVAEVTDKASITTETDLQVAADQMTDNVNSLKNIQALQKAILLAIKSSEDITEITIDDKQVYIIGNSQNIGGIESEITFSREAMNIESAPDVIRHDFNSESIAEAKLLLVNTWEQVAESNNFIILNTGLKTQVAMTTNADLIKAYKLGL